MPTKKKVTAEKSEIKGKRKFSIKLPGGLLKKILFGLVSVYIIIWIIIGLLLLLLLAQGFKQGLYQGLLNPNQPQQQQQTQVPQAPTEVDLPGVGRVNVACVQAALSDESIQTLITEESADGIGAEEREVFDKCVIGPATESSPSPAGI